jgi:predicted ATPase/signal transduction histidine kinase
MLKMPRAANPGPRERERYRREYRLMERLSGTPGVLKVYGCEDMQERPVLVLQDVGGKSLSEVLTQGPLPLRSCLELALSVATTLAQVHRRGIIHKDLKPSNLLLGAQGEVWLIDFGIATLQPAEHVEAVPAPQVQGTLAYMSPEQTGRMNRVLDYRTDFYSLGVTLYEALTGHKPLHGKDALEWFHAHLAQAPRPPHELNPDIPRMVSAIVLKLMAKGAEERYQSAEGLQADLEECLARLRQQRLEEFPLGEKDAPATFRMPHRLYGREKEVQALLEGFDRVASSGRPELLLVSGYSGIGKSSVVNELQRPVLERRSFFLRGKFDQFARDVPYATLAQALRGLVQQLLASSDAELEAWRQQLHTAWEGQGQVLVELVPQLELVVGPQSPVPALPPAEAQSRFTRLFERLLRVFATRERPLLLFLDDWQWADPASLKLIQHLIVHAETLPVLLVGAYRDNEVGASHPLMQTLAEMQQSGALVGRVHLSALETGQTQQLLVDALSGIEQSEVSSLAELVQHKTGGNPFFVLQLLRTLYRDGLVTRVPGGGWLWDSEAVRARGYSDNVVDFMVSQLRQLPATTQQLLSLAACVGSDFALEMLAQLSGQPSPSVERGLEDAFQRGLLAQVAPEAYRFQHDRIQQAAYTLLPEAERKAVHLRIGRMLLATLSAEDQKEKLFDLVNHLNAGAELVGEPAEREKLARLNAEAGRKAKASAAYSSAAAYFSLAFSLFPGDPWEADYSLAFSLGMDRALCELMSGNGAEARRLMEEVLPRTRDRLHMMAAYHLKSDILLGTGETVASATSILECLERLGVPISPHPTEEEIAAAYQEVQAILAHRSVETIAELPLVTDPYTQALMNLQATFYAKAFFIDVNLFRLNILRLTALCLRHGNSEASALTYALYAFLHVATYGRYREADAFARVVQRLAERFGINTYSADVNVLLESVSLWNHHSRNGLELARKGFQQSLHAGAYQPAGIFAYHMVYERLLLGHALSEVNEEARERRDFVRRLRFRDAEDFIRMYQRYVQQMRGLSRSFHTLSGDDFEEEAFEASLAQDRLWNLPSLYWALKMQSRYMAGAYEQARQASDQAREMIGVAIGHLQLLEYNQYRGLTLAACYADAPASQQAELLEQVAHHHRTLKEWAEACPDNFLAPERMVFAEWARLSGKKEEAWRAYEEAVDAARQYGYIQNVALANELAARFWKAQRMASIALSYAREARDAYRQWGAVAKVRQLEAQWPQLEAAPSSPDTTSTDTNSRQIDALTVVKAQQVISSEIVLEKLGKTLLQVAMENAGAQRGALLLTEGEKLVLAASAGVEKPGAEVVPWTLVAYVRRTREVVLLGDASRPHPYSSDRYFQQTGARSVLCVPLSRQGQFHGVLYLENELAADAFTPGNQALLGHIATQAAISMENARLYSEVQQAEAALRKANEQLEARVEERTQQLQQAQARLMDTARAVGMAEVASNVLHNVGNVLTSVVVETQFMREAINASFISKIGPVGDLLAKHRDRLAEFLTQDERGIRLPDYLSALSKSLVEEQSQLKTALQSLEKHVEHIRAIVQVQQTYAKTTLLEEECDLRTLVEDALRIQLATPVHRKVRVTRELQPLPRVRLDKHKVLQILINLLSNAHYALEGIAEADRHIQVRLGVRDGSMYIQVVDNGVGMTPEVRERLFTHGFTTRPDGHGFGLHASAVAASQLGGRLSVESAGPGRGATATLEIPLDGGNKRFGPGAQGT